MENDENEDDEESSFIPFINLLKLKIIFFEVLPSVFKEKKHSKFRFALLFWIDQYSNHDNMTICKLYASISRGD
jgi:hypothetical protein